MEAISLGRKYKDKITGFKGVATGHVEYISGCNQTLLVPKASKEGSLREAEWFDDQRLEATGSEVIRLDNAATPGCDKAAPKR